MSNANTIRRKLPFYAVLSRAARDAAAVRDYSRRMVMIAVIAILSLLPVTAAISASAVPLGAASTFAVLGASTVTNTGATLVSGDVGLSPGTSVTGFPPGVVTGVLHVNDGIAATAQANNVTAYGLLAAQACDVSFAGPTDMAGMTLLPGTYCFNSSGANTGLLTLNGAGNSNAVWIFRTASTLITGTGSSVVAINGGQACNVFWQVGTSATFGTATQMIGSVLALTSITANTGSSISGRALAQTGAVTLDTNSVTVCSLLPQAVPALSKAFAPTQINAGGTSTLTVTLSNPNPFLITLTAPLMDTLPNGLVIAAVPNASTSCGGGVLVSATAGANTVTLPMGATVGSASTCSISVAVTSAQPGVYVNTIPINALQTSNGNNLAPAVATLTVVGLAVPALSKAFNPGTINSGATSTLTITLTNANPAPATTTSALIDTLPSGVVIASVPNASTTCGGGGLVNAQSGASAVTLPAGAIIGGNGICTVSVNVTSSQSGTYVNTISANALQTTNGNNPAPASAPLIVVASTATSLSKSFTPGTINAGGISTLTIVLTNANATLATTTAALVDTLPSGVVIAPVPNASTTCGGGSAVTTTAGGNSVTLPSGRSIPANGSCSVAVAVTTATAGSYLNTLPVAALQTTNGNNPAPALATLLVAAVVPPAAAASIPTLSHFLIAVLGVLLTAVSLVAIRKRAL